MEATRIITQICGNEPIKQLPQKQRHNAINAVVAAGVSMRQLSRIAQIDYKTIAVIIEKSK